MTYTPSTFAGDLGEALGTFVGSGLESLAKTKVENLKRNAQKQKAFNESPQRLNTLLNSLGRKDYNASQRDEILKRSQQFLKQGYGPGQAELLGLQDFENNPYTDDPNSPLGILQQASKKNETPLHERTQARFSDLFKTKESEDVIALQEKVREKSKKSKSIDDFTFDELSVMTPDIVSNLPESEQKKFYENTAPFLAQQAEGIRKLGSIPFLGGGLEERAREALQPTLPPPPPIANISRIASELPFFPSSLGKGNLLEKMVRGAAFFGGDAAANEAIRTLGTDKPVDLKQIGIQSLLGAAFPVGEELIKALGKPFRNAIAKKMKKEGINASESTQKVLKDAEKAGISIENLEKGNEKEARKFYNYLTGETKEEAAKTRQVTKPSPKARKEVISPRSEGIKEAEKRFAKEAKALSETPLEKYLQEAPVKKAGYAERKETITPKIQKTEESIKDLQKDLLQLKGEDLARTRKELENLKKKKYDLSYELKYGKKPLSPSEIKSQVEKSLESLVADVMSGEEKARKRLATNSKMMETFVNKAKDEVVKGKLPESVAADTFLNINREYLKAYKDLQDLVRTEMAIPASRINASQSGPKLLHELDKRIKGIEAALKTQEQKRKALGALKGAKGKFYRKWAQDLRDDIKLFDKDLIRLDKSLRESEKNLTPKMKKHFEDIGRNAAKEGSPKIEKTLKEAGSSPSSAKEATEALKKIREAPHKEFKSFEDARLYMKKYMNELLKPIKNQAIAGLLLGSLDHISQEAFGKKIPSKVKYPVLGAAGLYGKTGSRKPVLALTAFFTDLAWHEQRINQAKKSLQGKKGKDYLREMDRIKKSGKFSPKEIKKIREES